MQVFDLVALRFGTSEEECLNRWPRSSTTLIKVKHAAMSRERRHTNEQ